MRCCSHLFLILSFASAVGALSGQSTTLEAELAVFPSNDLGSFRVSVEAAPVLVGMNGSSASVAVAEETLVAVAIDAGPATSLQGYSTEVSCTGGGLGVPFTASFALSALSPRVFQLPIPVGDGTPIRCLFSNFLGGAAPVPLDFSTSCEATAVPPVVRSEGIAEVVADVVLSCTNSGPGAPNLDTLIGRLSVDINVNVTNNIDFGAGALVTDALIIVNENNCTTPSAAGSSFGCGSDVRFQAPQYGTLTADNRLEWSGVSFPVPNGEPQGAAPFPAVTTIRITGIRVDSSAAGPQLPYAFPSTTVTASLAFSGSADIPITNNGLWVAVPIVGLVSEIQAVSGSQLEVALQEGFATSFKTQGEATFAPGQTQWESGYFAPGSNNGGGVSSGTRFLLRFLGFDPGTILSIPRQIDLGTPQFGGDGLQVALVAGADVNGAGGAATVLTGDETITLTSGSGAAVYEVLDADPFRVEEVSIPVSFPSGGFAANWSITATFAAVSSVATASAAAPEPRFKDDSITVQPPERPQFLDLSITPSPVQQGSLATVTIEAFDLYPGISSVSVEIFQTSPNPFGPGLTAPLTPSGGDRYTATIDTSELYAGTHIVLPTVVSGATTWGFQDKTLDILCTYTITDPGEHFPAAGGVHVFELTLSPGCGWQAKDSFWITGVTRPTTIPQTWSLIYWVAPNPTSEARAGSVEVFDNSDVLVQTHIVTQDAGPAIPPTASRVGTHSDGLWRLDADGNGAFDAGADRSFALGFPGAQHFVGDWNGDGLDSAGVYKDGFWFLDYYGDDQWDGGVNDKLFPFGWIGATPVVGDWNGDGKTDVGVYNNGFWFLDYNGNLRWDDALNDRQFGFGWAGVEIQIGDWNGDGRDKVGIFKDGFWFLDYDGDYQWDGGVTDRVFGFGWAGVTPVIGDWNGDGRDKAGVWVNGFWFLDYDGDTLWDGGTTDRLFGWGASTATPVVGDWDNDGSDSAGAVLNGEWVLDVDGDALWDGGTVDKLFNFGAGEPVVGRW